jgi:L-fucose dehydrogenase
MDLGLKEKVIVITGAAKGIGAAIALLLAKEGATAIVIGRKEEDNGIVVKQIEDAGGKAFQYAAELGNPDECKKICGAIIEQFKRVDGLVNNAGVNDGVGLENGNYTSFIQSLHNNLVHYYMMAQGLLPALIKSKGSIVNISSKTAETGQGNTSAYAASNGGRNALTREWAVELLKYGIRVNAVVVAECRTPQYDKWITTLEHPEQILKQITDLIPLENRMTTAEEIANMTAFLLSPVSSHTTGQLIHVDGGYVHLDRALSKLRGG